MEVLFKQGCGYNTVGWTDNGLGWGCFYNFLFVNKSHEKTMLSDFPSLSVALSLKLVRFLSQTKIFKKI